MTTILWMGGPMVIVSMGMLLLFLRRSFGSNLFGVQLLIIGLSLGMFNSSEAPGPLPAKSTALLILVFGVFGFLVLASLSVKGFYQKGRSDWEA